MSSGNQNPFDELNFEKFRELAQDQTLSIYEKIGFPDAYRAGKTEIIFADIQSKLTLLNQTNKIVLDVGPGCSDLPLRLIEHCRRQKHTLILIDSPEMLNFLPDAPFIIKIPAFYPQECSWLFEKYTGQVDVILTYSVIQYVFAESNYFQFVDKSLTLLAEGGQFLIGDIPNISKRKRFFSSPAGIKQHQEYSGTAEIPAVIFNNIELDKIDDAAVLALLMRVRSAGYHAFVVPQAADLPMANRREDILIKKP